jgi:hypothetical protein
MKSQYQNHFFCCLAVSMRFSIKFKRQSLPRGQAKNRCTTHDKKFIAIVSLLTSYHHRYHRSSSNE